MTLCSGPAVTSVATRTQLDTFCSAQSAATVSARASDVTALALANNRFGLSFYSQLSKNVGNLTISPYSIGGVLSMVREGAKGKTASQLTSALKIPSTINDYEATFAALKNQVICEAMSQGYAIALANAEWAQSGFDLLPTFTKILTSTYAASFSTLNFSGANLTALATINSWVARETRGVITKLFDIIDPSTVMILANAFYLRADWESPFPARATAAGTFYNLTAPAASVPLMHQLGDFKYAKASNYDLLELPYKKDRFVMNIFLPHNSVSLAAVEKTVLADTEFTWTQLFSYSEPVDLTLPKFKIEGKLESPAMVSALKGIGITEAFSNADFSGISNAPAISFNQWIHRTALQVDETGTVVAAATATGSVTAPAAPNNPVVFRVDHPFFFMIRDAATGTVVFMGRVTDVTP